MITAITTTTFQKEFNELIKKLNPKPDVWIIFNDSPKKIVDHVKVFSRIAHNYNKIRTLVPDSANYVVIMEDDILYREDIQKVYLDLMNTNKYDILTTPVMHRHGLDFDANYSLFPMVWYIKYEGDSKCRFWVNGEGVQEVDASSLHYVFMKKEVIDKIQFTGINVTGNLSIDEYFFLSAKKLGYRIFCNFDIKTIHRGCLWSGYNKNASSLWKDPYK